jgi:hypothetical protein
MRRQGWQLVSELTIPYREIDAACDVQVDGKVDQIVMIIANIVGRQAVQSLWPAVEWSTDRVFSTAHSGEWLFTHICVTQFPSDLESEMRLTSATPDQLGFAVALAIRHIRVIWFEGDGADLKICTFDHNAPALSPEFALLADYVAPGFPVIETGKWQ